MRRVRGPRPGALVWLLGASAAVASAFAGLVPLFVVSAALLAYAQSDLQLTFGRKPSAAGTVAGTAGVLAFLSVGGWLGVEHLPWVMAGLLLLLFVARIARIELGGAAAQGSTDEVAATIASSGIVGLLGAHVMLVRSTPRFGLRGTLLFLLLVLACEATSSVADRVRPGRRIAAVVSSRTWHGAVSGVVAAAVAGTALGFVLDPPFGLVSGLGLGCFVGILTVMGGLTEAVLRTGAALGQGPGLDAGPPRERPLQALRPGGGAVWRAAAGLLFCAPFFYWTFRTLVL